MLFHAMGTGREVRDSGFNWLGARGTNDTVVFLVSSCDWDEGGLGPGLQRGLKEGHERPDLCFLFCVVIGTREVRDPASTGLEARA